MCYTAASVIPAMTSNTHFLIELFATCIAIWAFFYGYREGTMDERRRWVSRLGDKP